MPNWCATEWQISGSGEDVKLFVNMFRGAFHAGTTGSGGVKHASPMIMVDEAGNVHPRAVHTPFTCAARPQNGFGPEQLLFSALGGSPGGGFQYVWEPTYKVLPSLNKIEACSHCGVKDKPLGRCGKCRNEAYCSKECQKAAWKTHKAECMPCRVSIVHTSKWNHPWGPAQWAKIAAAFPGSTSIEVAEQRLAMAKIMLGGQSPLVTDVLELVGKNVTDTPLVIEIKYAEQGMGLIGSATLRGGKIVEQLERTVGEQDRAAPREVDTDEEEEDYYERPRYTGPFAKLLEMSG